ncbi:MAG TPA: ABC transporter permease [Solirubrobacteraceae bacterium]|nr:ABC transporter permease [Solirubrobacteraceae bacterium]
MAAIEPSRSRSRRPSMMGLLGRQVGYQLKLLVRSPMAAFATILIPLMVLLAVNLLYSGTYLSSRGGIAYAQFFTPAMVAFAVVNACYMSVISSTTLARDQGILKRIRSTPLPPWVYMTGRIISSGLVATVGAVIVIAVGAGVYHFEVIWSGVPAAVLTLAVAMFCFCSLGLAVTVLVPSAESAVPIAWGTMLLLCFVSDVFQPIDNAPHWLRAIASAFPLRPFADDLESAFNPVTGSGAIHPAHLEVMLVWGAAAAAFALLAFRWEPGGAHREGRGARGSATFASERVRGLLEAHGRRVIRPQPTGQPPVKRTAAQAPMGRGAGEPEPIEWIEGPAPAEDSSVPSEPLARPRPRSKRGSPVASSRDGRMRSKPPLPRGPGADGVKRHAEDDGVVGRRLDRAR